MNIVTKLTRSLLACMACRFVVATAAIQPNFRIEQIPDISLVITDVNACEAYLTNEPDVLVRGAMRYAVSPSHLSDDAFSVGSTGVTVTATKGDGTVAFTTFTVTVTENVAPELQVSNRTYEVGADGTATLDLSHIIYHDNCDTNPELIPVTKSLLCSDVGVSFPVIVEVKDSSGNVGNATFEATTTDPNDYCHPEITSPAENAEIGAIEGDAFAFSLSVTGETAGLVYSITGGAHADELAIDANAGLLYFNSEVAPAFEADGENLYEVTVTAKNAHDFQDTVRFSVRVFPSIQIETPGGITKFTDTDKCSAIVDFQVGLLPDDGSVDADLDPKSGDSFNVGSTTVHITAQRAQPAQSLTDSFNVVVVDNEPPQISVEDVTYQLDMDTRKVSVDSRNPISSVSDNCGVQDGFAITGPKEYTCADLGTFQVTVYKTDVNGNQASASFHATVEEPGEGVCDPNTDHAKSDVVLTVDASNMDVPQPKYKINGGTDQSLFFIGEGTGEVTWQGQIQGDTNADGVYELEVSALGLIGGSYVPFAEYSFRLLQQDIIPPTSAPSSSPSGSPSLAPSSLVCIEEAFRCGDDIYVCGGELDADDVILPVGDTSGPNYVFQDRCARMKAGGCGARCPNGENVEIHGIYQCDDNSAAQKTYHLREEVICQNSPGRRLGEVSAAEKACSHVQKPAQRESCVSEVLLTKNIRVASTYKD